MRIVRVSSAGLLVCACLLCAPSLPSRATGETMTTRGVDASDFTFSARVVEVPPSPFDQSLKRAVVGAEPIGRWTTRLSCPDSVHLFVISEARNIAPDTLRFCGMLTLQGGYTPLSRERTPEIAPVPDKSRGQSWPVLYVLPKTAIAEEPFRCRSAILPPGASFADTLHIPYCSGEFRDWPGTLHLSGSFLIGKLGETNEQATVVAEDAVVLDVPIP